MLDPQVLLLVLAIAGGIYVYDEVKPVAVKIAHVTKATGHKIVHVLTFGKK
jgi:hypothetical protein